MTRKEQTLRRLTFKISIFINLLRLWNQFKITNMSWHQLYYVCKMYSSGKVSKLSQISQFTSKKLPACFWQSKMFMESYTIIQLLKVLHLKFGINHIRTCHGNIFFSFIFLSVTLKLVRTTEKVKLALMKKYFPQWNYHHSKLEWSHLNTVWQRCNSKVFARCKIK